MAEFIGPFSFVRISGMPTGHRTKTEFETRPGVDGVFVWNIGKQGEPFSVVTFADAPTLFDAQLLIQQYEAVIFENLPISYGEIQQPKLVNVLDVAPVAGETKTILLGVGGLNGESYAVAVAEWTLVTTDIDA